MAAFDGQNSSVGALSEPRGMAVDDQGLLYLADTGNDRVVVFRAVTEFDSIRWSPCRSSTVCRRPMTWTSPTAARPSRPRTTGSTWPTPDERGAAIYPRRGFLAACPDRWASWAAGPVDFAGPMALTVGRFEGASSDDVYVADAHNGRVVHLQDSGSGLAWVGAWDMNWASSPP